MTSTESHTHRMDWLENTSSNTNLDDIPEADSLIRWRMEKVWELRSMGCTIDEITAMLRDRRPEVKISHGTVCRDLKLKQQEIESNFKDYIEELPAKHEEAITGLDLIRKKCWGIFSATHDDRIRLQALALAQSAIIAKQELLGDPVQIQRAIELTSRIRKQLREIAS